MKRYFYLIILLVCHTASAQTVIIDPHTDGGFEMGSTFAANGWTLINNADGVGNNWRITNTTLSSGVISFAPTDNNVAFISQYSTGTTWSYNINTYSTTHFYKDVSFPAGEEIIKLRFRWNAKGEGTATATYDVLYVYLCPTTLNPVLNSPFNVSSVPSAWTGAGTAVLMGAFHSCSSSSGATADITIPASYAGTSQRLVFTWKNGNIYGVQPPIAIDSIALTSDCPKSVISISDLSAPCTSHISLSTSVTIPSPTGTYQWYVNDIPETGATSSGFTSTGLVSGDVVKCVYSMNNACEYTDTASILIDYSVNDTAVDFLNICSKDLPMSWRGISIPEGTGSDPEYAVVIVPKPDGCDSIITLNLEVKPTPDPVTETISTCRNLLSGMSWRGKSLPPDAMSNEKYDSVYVPYPGGCDSVIYLDLHVIDSATTILETYRDCKSVTYDGREYTSSTILSDTLLNMSNCDSVYHIVEITIDNFSIGLEVDTNSAGSFYEGEKMNMRVTSDEPDYRILSWNPPALFADQHATSQTFPAPFNETISVVASNPFGCMDTAYYQVNSIKMEKDYILPNAFSPNGDGLNDVFGPVFKMDRHNHVVFLEIYDRWGNKMFSNYSNSSRRGWDGYYNGKRVNAGVYFYLLIINFSDGSREIKKGDIHLVY